MGISLHFLVQPGSPLGIPSTKTSESGAGGGTGGRLLFVWRMLSCDLPCLRHTVYAYSMPA